MQAEIISIGTELLLGAIVDTNAAYISRQLAEVGIDLYYRQTVGDNESRIARCIEEALERADVVICSGGLGPTVDDVLPARPQRGLRAGSWCWMRRCWAGSRSAFAAGAIP